MADTEKITADEVATLGLDDWRPVLGALRTRFATGDFVSGLGLVTRVADAAEEANHHPDVDLRYPHVDIALTSHDVGGLTQRDVDLARRISELAADLGVTADPAAPVVVEVGLDSWDGDEVGPFWAAVLGGDYAHNQVTAGDRVPAVWFQETDRHELPRQRFHLDVWVPPDLAQQRIDAALAAGGTLVTDEHAPSYVVLADPQGNKACICTSASRG
jgi:4a-hydroxytetrahydrobiopterin dehydratase